MTDNLKGTTLRTSLALLTALVLLNSACAIVSYSPTEPVVKPLIEIHDKRELLSFSYSPGSPLRRGFDRKQERTKIYGGYIAGENVGFAANPGR